MVVRDRELRTSVELPACLARIRAVHLRLPAFAPGVTAFLWALGLALYIWLGMLAIGEPQAVSFVVAAVAGFFIFLFVRICGRNSPPTG